MPSSRVARGISPPGHPTDSRTCLHHSQYWWPQKRTRYSSSFQTPSNRAAGLWYSQPLGSGNGQRVLFKPLLMKNNAAHLLHRRQPACLGKGDSGENHAGSILCGGSVEVCPAELFGQTVDAQWK